MEHISGTYCGRCGQKGMNRETRKHSHMNRKDVIYTCLNPLCTKAECIIVELEGQNNIKERIGGYRLGDCITVNKYRLFQIYESEETK
jgi:hypothetical protein